MFVDLVATPEPVVTDQVVSRLVSAVDAFEEYVDAGSFDASGTLDVISSLQQALAEAVSRSDSSEATLTALAGEAMRLWEAAEDFHTAFMAQAAPPPATQPAPPPEQPDNPPGEDDDGEEAHPAPPEPPTKPPFPHPLEGLPPGMVLQIMIGYFHDLTVYMQELEKYHVELLDWIEKHPDHVPPPPPAPPAPPAPQPGDIV